MKDDLKYIFGNLRTHIMNGVSHMIPVVVAGGIIMALSLLLSGGIEVADSGLAKMMFDTGGVALGLMVPVLSAYISYSIADRPGLAAGLVGGMISTQIGAGFLGGIVSGILAGTVAYFLKKIKLPLELKSLGSIMIIPIVSVFTVGIVMFLIGVPIAGLMKSVEDFIRGVDSNNKIILGLILGAMIAVDLGGPINKVAYSLMVATIGEGIFNIGGPIAVAIAVPPLACGVASAISKKKFTKEQQDAGKSSIIMGLVGITEGAIPFAASEPLRVLPSLIVGSAIGSAVAFVLDVQTHAAWGGLITLPLVENKIGFVIAHIVGVAVSVILLLMLKKPVNDENIENVQDEDVNIEINF